MIDNIKLGFELFFKPTQNIRRNGTLLRIATKKMISVYSERTELYYTTKKRDLQSGKLTLLQYPILETNACIKTPMLEYVKAIKLLKQVLGFIREHASTDDSCSMYVNISVGNGSTTNFMQKLDILKFCIGINEEDIYRKFPNRRYFNFAKSVKHIFPTSVNSTLTQETVFTQKYEIKLFDQYSGIDFSKLLNGYVKFRYLGGNKYERKETSLIACIDMMVELTKRNINNNSGYVDAKLLEKTRTYYLINAGLKNAVTFKFRFPKINLTVDIRSRLGISTHLPIMADDLLYLLSRSKIREGDINYNTDINRLEVKGVDIKTMVFLKDINILNSTISNSVIENCNTKNNTFKNCILINCVSYADKIDKCVIEDILGDEHTEIKSSFIQGEFSVVKGTIKTSTIIQASLRDSTDIDKKTIVLNLENNPPKRHDIRSQSSSHYQDANKIF